MNELHFSANGLGVVLKTKHGGLRFTAEEFAYYQNVFKIADSHGLGKLMIKSVQLNSLLIRTDIEWSSMEKILSVVSKYQTEGDDKEVYFYQWLMICKLIAFYQETKRTISDKVFKNLHTTKIKIPFANFALGQARQTFAVGTYYEDLKVTLAEWIFSGEEFQNQHFKFRIETTSTPVKVKDGTATEGPDYSLPTEKYSVERRYSEFEAFSTILQKNYKSIVIPPLPLKTWSFLSPQSEATAHQRAVEFQMFLNDLTSHPILRYSYELKAFLQTSSQGYKSFVELYSHIHEGKFVSVGSPSNQQLNEVVTKLFVDGAAAVTSSATSFFSSMWDTVKKNVPTALLPAAPPSRPLSSENDQKLLRTALFLDNVLNAGKKLENIVTNEREYYTELAKIALCCKYMAEFETIPELTRVLTASHTGISAGSKTLLQITDKLHFEAQIPIVYMGRYKESFHAVQKEHKRVLEEQHAAKHAEQFAQQRVDLASQNTNNTSNGNGSNGYHTHSNGTNQNGSATTSPGAGTTSTTISSVQSQAEQSAAAAEQAYNQAKLDLAAAEDTYETKRMVAEEVTVTVRAEATRLESLERAQLVKCAKALVYARIEAARSNVKFWEELKADLEMTVT